MGIPFAILTDWDLRDRAQRPLGHNRPRESRARDRAGAGGLSPSGPVRRRGLTTTRRMSGGGVAAEDFRDSVMNDDTLEGVDLFAN